VLRAELGSEYCEYIEAVVMLVKRTSSFLIDAGAVLSLSLVEEDDSGDRGVLGAVEAEETGRVLSTGETTDSS
jgi:hypothetical protein